MRRGKLCLLFSWRDGFELGGMGSYGLPGQGDKRDPELVCVCRWGTCHQQSSQCTWQWWAAPSAPRGPPTIPLTSCRRNQSSGDPTGLIPPTLETLWPSPWLHMLTLLLSKGPKALWHHPARTGLPGKGEASEAKASVCTGLGGVEERSSQ